ISKNEKCQGVVERAFFPASVNEASPFRRFFPLKCDLHVNCSHRKQNAIKTAQYRLQFCPIYGIL
ncbi:MAG: hypothetical protein K5695_11685, partial [Oscillospiraceae bacterium]|nr:hypothetical protein [Oscillospiraceae bacterium]